LLSAERTNRDVLRSLQRWNRFVFKRHEARQSLEGVDLPPSTSSSSSSSALAINTSTSTGLVEGLDEDGRPKHKVIMLCGPPGTGKVRYVSSLSLLFESFVVRLFFPY
jgi:chromosome transmission fidelity protein 18